MQTKRRLDLAVALVGFAHLGDGPNDHLRGQPEPLPDIIVDERLQPQLVGDTMPVRHVRNLVAGGVERLQRAQEGGMVFWLRSQFHEQRLLHGTSVPELNDVVTRRVAPSADGSAFLPTAEAGGILRRFW